MAKKQTAGERIAAWLDDQLRGTKAGWVPLEHHLSLTRRIDRAIRAAEKRAYERGWHDHRNERGFYP